MCEIKKCKKCESELVLSSFYKNKRRKDGLHDWCKKCHSKDARQRYNNKDSEEKRKYWRNYYKNNSKKLNKQSCRYARNNRKKINARKQWRMKNDYEFKLLNLVRSRIWEALKRDGGSKTERTIKYVGCSISELRQHLENQFKEGMTWDNNSHNGWHIDHIIPLNRFDLSDPEQQRIAFHFTNLQPLWARDNLIKK